MTVASTLSKKQYQGNNLTSEFPLPFHVTAKEHIFALLKKGTKIEEIKNNYAVDLERKMFIYPVQGEAIKTGESLTVYRKIPLTQIVDLENAGAFHPEVLEHDGFDRIVMQIQQIDEEISRALKIDITDTRDTSHLLEELFAAREEAVLACQKALEQAKAAADKAEITKDWAQFAEEKVKELTDLSVECFISNDGQGQVIYDKEKHKLEIVLPFDNAGASQSKIVLTDSTDLARSDIGASAKAVYSLQTKIGQDLQDKIPKSAISNAIDSESEENVASSFAVSALNKIKTDGKVTLKGSRTTDGLLTLTDLTPYKPVIVLCKLNITSGVCGTYIATVSGGGTGDTEGHSYGIGSIPNKFVSTNCYVVIPVSATVVLSFYMMGNAKIEAYQ